MPNEDVANPLINSGRLGKFYHSKPEIIILKSNLKTMSISTHFIIMDDDPIDKMICKTVIRKACPESIVITFVEPEQILEYFRNGSSADLFILFLDINMPIMTGWQFLDELSILDEEIKNRISVFVLSASVDFQKKTERAANEMIKDSFSKPLTVEKLMSVLEQQLPV